MVAMIKHIAILLTVGIMSAFIVPGCQPSNSELTTKRVPTITMEELMKCDHGSWLINRKGWRLYPPCDWVHVPYDIYMTCLVEDGKPSKWVWNGRVIGHDEEGWQAICKKLEKLPKKSRVLLYPRKRVDITDNFSCHPIMGYSSVSWDFESIQSLAHKRELIIIYSARDHNGKIHPDLQREYDLCLRKKQRQGMQPPTPESNKK